MPRYRYRALRQGGGEIEGELFAEDEREAVAHLQTDGSFPIEIAPAALPSFSLRHLARRARFTQRERVLFTRQIAALLGAGVMPDRALRLIANDRAGGPRALAARALLASINRGESLSRAAAELRILSQSHVMMITAGETRGDLAGAFERIAAILERNRSIGQSLANALVYPASVLVVACLSIVFLLGLVLPRFEGLLASFRREPPLLMRMLLDLSVAVQNYGWLLALLVVALVVAFMLKRRDAAFRVAADRTLLRLPILGPMLMKIESERLGFLLGTMIAAGVAVPAAVNAACEATSNAALRVAFADAAAAIERGERVADALASTGLMSEMALELARIGEETGDLAAMMLKASDILRGEIEATATEWIAILAPLSMILLGLLIGAIALAVFGTVLEVYDIAP